MLDRIEPANAVGAFEFHGPTSLGHYRVEGCGRGETFAKPLFRVRLPGKYGAGGIQHRDGARFRDADALEAFREPGKFQGGIQYAGKFALLVQDGSSEVEDGLFGQRVDLEIADRELFCLQGALEVRAI